MASADRTHLAPTPRQIQIAQLIADGCSLGDVAQELGVTRYTIKSTVANLGARLGLHTRAEIVVEMMRRGLVR